MKTEIEYYNNFTVKSKPIYESLSRLFDIVASFAVLLIGLPFVLLTAFAIKIEDRGPVMYVQNRTGKDGKEFKIYKVRSMCVNADKVGSSETDVDDERITKVGKFARKTRIDEIPQLLNILKGDMKIIGPRPLVPDQIQEFTHENPEFINRLIIKPGLTGLAQVNGGNDMGPEEKLQYDLGYIKHRGLIIDFKILIKTVLVVLTGDGAR